MSILINKHKQWLTNEVYSVNQSSNYMWRNIDQLRDISNVLNGHDNYYNIPYSIASMLQNANEFTIVVASLTCLKYFEALKDILYGMADAKDYLDITKFKRSADKIINLDKTIFNENGEFYIRDISKRQTLSGLMDFCAPNFTYAMDDIAKLRLRQL